MISRIYRAQVDLLLQVLPYVAKEEIFALKGGTAINLFFRDMPRLSVDLDLVYLPSDDRVAALTQIQQALDRIRERIKEAVPGISVTSSPQIEGHEVKLNCQLRNAHVKIEVNATTRGHIYPTRLMQVTETVQESFGKFAAINVVSTGELYGGKICAAMDRQHPRDLFDIRLLLDNEGFTEDIRIGFLFFLLSHSRPMHEVISPNFLDQRSAFETQFSGMADIPFSYADYEETRIQLVETINAGLTQDDRKFLMGFKSANPDWSLFPIGSLEYFPSIKWKLTNIRRLMATNSQKHKSQLNELGKKLRML